MLPVRVVGIGGASVARSGDGGSFGAQVSGEGRGSRRGLERPRDEACRGALRAGRADGFPEDGESGQRAAE